MNHEERITEITLVDLKLQYQGQVYVIIAIDTYLLKELRQLQTLQLHL